MNVYIKILSRFLCCFSLFLHISVAAFSNLQELRDYAELFAEDVTSDNKSVTSPDFLSTYQARSFTPIDTFKNFIGLKSGAYPLLKKTLESLNPVVLRRELQGYGYRHVALLNHKPGDVLFVWGDLQGAFHSLVRALTELHSRGVINENLVIVNPHHYFVFNANIVGASPVNLEMIALIATLMNKNPNNILYIAGKHEEYGHWIGQGVLTQMAVLAGLQGAVFTLARFQQNRFDELRSLIDRFFNTLPIALYLPYKSDGYKGKQLICVSGLEYNATEFSLKSMDDFFGLSEDSSGDIICTYRIENKVPSAHPAFVKVLITSVEGSYDFQKTSGLIQLNPFNGATIWSVFSGSNMLHRSVNKFYNDAFVQISLSEKLSDATIELFSRDMRTHNTFCSSEKFFLASGWPVTSEHAEAQLEGNLVVLGASLDISKGAESWGKGIRKGATAALDKFNKQRLPSQKALHIAFFDDGFSPRQALLNLLDIEKEYKEPVVCFPIASVVLADYFDKIKTNEVSVLFPVVGAPSLHSSKYPGFIFFRSSFEKEVRVLLQHAVHHAKDAHFCFFYEDDEFGTEALEVAREYLRKAGIKEWVELPYIRNAAQFKVQIEKFKKSEVDALVFFSMSLAAREFIQQLGVENLLNADLYGFSMLGSDLFKDFIAERGLVLHVTQVVPNPEKSDFPIVQEFRAQMDAIGEPHDTPNLEGYITASLLIDAITHIVGPITKKSLEGYFTSFKNYDFKGLKLTFNPEHRDFDQPVWLEHQDEPEWELESEGAV